MGHLRKIGKNYMYEFVYRGRRYSRSLKVADKKNANALKSVIDYEIALGSFNPNALGRSARKGGTVFEFIEEFDEYLKGMNFTRSTKESYKYSSELLKEILGNMPMIDVTSVLVDKKVLTYLNMNYAEASVRHYLIDFRSMFSRAKEWGYTDENPFHGKVPKLRKRMPHYYVKDELEKLGEYFSNPRLPRWQGDMVFFTLNTGLRREEVFMLDWREHVDLANEQIIFPGKGDKDRVVPLNQDAMEILQSRPRHIKKSRVFWEIDRVWAIDSMWRRMKLRTKIKGKFHDLRKTYASYYVMAGGSMKRLQEILGHADYETVGIYAAFSPDSIQVGKNIVSFSNKIRPKANAV